MFSIIRSYCFVLLFLSYDVLCTRISEECVTYNFEENENANFTNTYGICIGMSNWEIGEYKRITKESPNRQSSLFITPKQTLSCISSFKFVITGLGILELNVYMAPTANTDQITLLVFQSLPGANDATVGNAVLSKNVANFVPGWQTIRVNIIGIGKHEGYITLLGMASEKSTVLVDSFRYVAPEYDKDSCVIYPEAATTTEITVELTEDPTTTHVTSTPGRPTITPTTNIPEITTSKPTPEKPTQITPEIPTTISPEQFTTIPAEEPTTLSPDKPTTIAPEKPTTIAPEKPTTIDLEKPTTIDLEKPTTKAPEKPTTIDLEKPTTIAPEKPTTIDLEKPTTIAPEKPTTIAPEKPTTIAPEKPSTPSSTTISTPGSSTQRPKLTVSILLIKIQKFFR